jgi:LysR family cys regulon transcriptional activator
MIIAVVLLHLLHILTRPAFEETAMNLRQLRTFCEIVDNGLLLTKAARRTCRSQSAVTRQIQLLEKELRVELFLRGRRKLLGLTAAGEEVAALARRMVRDADSMLNVGHDVTDAHHGVFTIATTNFYARYALPAAIRQFVKTYPKVKLSMRQGTPAQCSELVAAGKADLAVCAAGDAAEDVVRIPCFSVHRSAFTPPRHPLLRVKRLTLEALARYPLITFDEAFGSSWIVSKAFADRGLHPNIVLSAVDADVSKLYVGMGLGIAIFATVAFDAAQDASVRRIDARHLFPSSHLSLVLRRNTRLRGFAFDFIHAFAPHVDQAFVEGVVSGKSVAASRSTTLPEL